MEQNLAQTQFIIIAALAVFAVLMVCIGVYSSRKVKTIDGFLMGGRQIGAWMSAFSYGTSYFSAVIFVGYAGQHGWNIGLGSIWIGIGNAVLGCYLAWQILAKKTRNMTHTLRSKTMPEFFEGRYDATALKIVAAVIIFVFLVPYSAAVYKGLGSMFSTIFPNVPINVWLLIIAVLTGAYLALGGYVATAYTDFIQGIIMIAGVFAMVIAILKTDAVGGVHFIQRLAALDGTMADGAPVGKQLTSWYGGSSLRFLCINILLTSFGTWGLPQMVNKYYAIRDDNAARLAKHISTVFALIIGCGAYFVGSLSRLVLNNTLPEGGIDSVIPSTLLTALGDTNVATTIILAVILILLLSASMSTLASIVLSSASAISIDLVPTVKKGFKPNHQIILTRILCLMFVACSYIFATTNITIIVNIMSFSWGVISGCFIGPYVWGIYSKKTTKAGAWLGMICGFLSILVPTVVIALNSGFKAAASQAPLLGCVAMAVSLVVVPLVSLFTKKYDNGFIEKVFAENAD